MQDADSSLPSGRALNEQVPQIAGSAHSAAAPSADGSAWVALTDEDRDRAFNTLPDMLDGFLKKWGWLHFAKAIEEECRKKNAGASVADPVWCGCGDGIVADSGAKCGTCAFTDLLHCEADAEEMRFYRVWGHPYTDHSTMFRDDHEGLCAITLPSCMPSPTSEGTVSGVVLRAFTNEALYVKARAHIARIEAEAAQRWPEAYGSHAQSQLSVNAGTARTDGAQPDERGEQA